MSQGEFLFEPQDQRIELMIKALLSLADQKIEEAQEHLRNLTQSERAERSRAPSKKVMAQVFVRDRYVCRYCNRLTICMPALIYISKQCPELFPRVNPRKLKRNRTYSVFWELAASIDHLVPSKRLESKHPNAIDNLRTACLRCNLTKAQWLLAEIGWEEQPVRHVNWDGLSRAFVQAMKKNRISNSYLQEWERILEVQLHSREFEF